MCSTDYLFRLFTDWDLGAAWCCEMPFCISSAVMLERSAVVPPISLGNLGCQQTSMSSQQVNQGIETLHS